jgi:hypothetical protein
LPGSAPGRPSFLRELNEYRYQASLAIDCPPATEAIAVYSQRSKLTSSI